MAPHVPQLTTKWRAKLETSDQSEKIKPQILVEHFDLASQISDTSDLTSSSSAGNFSFGDHSDANKVNEVEKYRLLQKLQQLALNHHENPVLPSTSDNIDHTTLNKDRNLESNGCSGEPRKSEESNEEDFGSLTEFQSPIAKVVR